MSAITGAATEISERVWNEGEKQIQRLEGLTHPQRKRTATKRRSFGKLSLLVMIIGVAYAAYRAIRQTTSNDAAPAVHDRDTATREDETAPVKRLASAAL